MSQCVKSVTHETGVVEENCGVSHHCGDFVVEAFDL